MKNTLNEKKANLSLKIGVMAMIMILYTVPVFAGVENIGSNIGNWGVEQIGAISLCIVAFIGVKFLAKKAWVPCGVFFAIDAVIVYIINNPEKLEFIGETLFGIAVK